MEAILNDYLEKIDKYLKPLPVSDRVDIVKEIKSEMMESELQGKLSAEQILDRLGDPKELAGAYLGEAIVKSNRFNLRRFAATFAFYSLTGLSGMFVLPFTSVLAVSLMFCGIIAPVAGLLQLVGYLLGFDVPFVVIQLGSYIPTPPVAFLYAVIIGLLLLGLGKGCWRLTLKYLRAVNKFKGKSLMQQKAE